MKKIVLILVLFISISVNSYSQLITFDSLRVMLSSSQYDFKNPRFYYGSTLSNSNLVYEKWDSQNCNIAFRKIYFDSLGSEIMITNNTTGQNINPTMSDNIIVWQSNISGNWDIYYSLNTSGIWSAPILLLNSPQNETNPFIYSNRTVPIQYSFYYLAYNKNNDVYFKSYRVNTATWFPDTNLTQNISYNCLIPSFGMGETGGTRKIYFSMALSDTMKRVYTRTFTENYTTGIVSWNEGNELYQPKSQENFRILDGKYFYEYDTLGGTHSLGLYRDVYTFPVSGNNSNSDGTDFGIITDNLLYWHYAAFGCINKRNDSTSLKVVKNLSYYSPPNELYWKSFYLGDLSVNSRISVSSPVIKNNIFKLIVVCEKMLNGKSSFYATYMTDFASGIENKNETAENYSLNQNYPNPFNPVTKIKFDVASSPLVPLQRGIAVKLVVYDVTGREIQTLVNEKLQPGMYEVLFDGSGLSSGIYFYTLQTEKFTQSKRMVLLK